MMRKGFKHTCSIGILLLLVVSGIGQNTALKIDEIESESIFTSYTWESFFEQSFVKDTMAPNEINYTLLDAAVFYATNKIRSQYGLKSLKYSAPLNAMAAFHASQMAKRKFVGHENYFAIGYSTLDLRSKRFLANAGGENVANMFIHDYIPAKRYYTEKEGEQLQFYYSHNDEELQFHTYESFAFTMVKAWMSSPAHKDNILDKDFSYLGCAMRASFNYAELNKLPLAYAVQNFGY